MDARRIAKGMIATVFVTGHGAIVPSLGPKEDPDPSWRRVRLEILGIADRPSGGDVGHVVWLRIDDPNLPRTGASLLKGLARYEVLERLGGPKIQPESVRDVLAWSIYSSGIETVESKNTLPPPATLPAPPPPCDLCGKPNEWGMVNRPGGLYRCYGCRQDPYAHKI